MKKFIKIILIAVLLSSLLILSAYAADEKYDVNGDNTVNLLDVIVLLKEAVADSPDVTVDITGDGKVSLVDVIVVIKTIVNGNGGAVGSYYSYTDIVARLIDTEGLSVSDTGEVTAEFTSYDRRSAYTDGSYANWRVNGDGSGYIGDTDDGGQLIADITGAGYISRIWSATAGAGTVKVFIDGEEEARIAISFEEFFNCTAEPFVYENLCYNAAEGENCYVPITFSESCKIVAYGGYLTDANPEGWGKYYNISYTLFPEGTTVESMPATLSDEQKAALEAVDTFIGESIGTNPEGYTDAAFETFTVSKDSPAVKTLSGKGAISGLLVKVDSVSDDTYNNSYEAVSTLKNLRIKIYWDGEETPSVNSPLGDFFASSYGYTDVTTLYLGVRDDRTFYNYFYMPYLDGAKIEIYTVGDETETVSLSVNVAPNTVDEDDMLYYAAQFNLGKYHENALTNGEYDKTAERNPDYNFLTVTGAGRIVGVTLNNNKIKIGVDPLSYPGNPWWGEGDEKFFIDGETFPSWFGTGTEDFFGYAWCSPKLFNEAYHAQSYCEGGSNGIGNRVITRLLIGDSIEFNESFDGYIEKYYTDEYIKYGFTTYFYKAKDAVVENLNYDSEAVLDYFAPASEGEYLVEGEDLYINSFSTDAGYIDHQAMTAYSPAWSNNNQVLVLGLTVDDSVTFDLPAPLDGEYMLLASLANSKDFATVQTSVNGVNVGDTIDLYGAITAADYITEIGKVTLTEGYTNTLTFTVVGKNASATNYRIGIDFVLLIPASEYKSLSELDLSVYTDVPRLNTKRDAVVQDTYTFEGETDLYQYVVASVGTPTAQSMTAWGTDWSGSKQLWLYNKSTVGGYMYSYIWVEEAGSYDLSGGFTTAKDYGIITLKVNGTTVGTFDGYNTSVAHKTADFGVVTLKAGYNKILFQASSKNESATGYCIGVDYITVTKSIVYEGEDEMYTNASVTVGKTAAQTLSSSRGFSGSKQLFWTASAVDGTLTTSITVETADNYTVAGGFCTAKDYGAFDIYINGTKVGAFDGYASSLAHATATFGTVALTEGTNEIKLVITGKSDASTNYYVGVDYIKFIAN